MSHFRSSFVWRFVVPLPLLPVVVLAAACYRLATAVGDGIRDFVASVGPDRPDRSTDDTLLTYLAALDNALDAVKSGERRGFAAAARTLTSVTRRVEAVGETIAARIDATRSTGGQTPQDPARPAAIAIEGTTRSATEPSGRRTRQAQEDALPPSGPPAQRAG
jgi:hypothetical protein